MVPIFFLSTSDPINKLFINNKKQHYLEVEITYFITTIFLLPMWFYVKPKSTSEHQ